MAEVVQHNLSQRLSLAKLNDLATDLGLCSSGSKAEVAEKIAASLTETTFDVVCDSFEGYWEPLSKRRCRGMWEFTISCEGKPTLSDEDSQWRTFPMYEGSQWRTFQTFALGLEYFSNGGFTTRSAAVSAAKMEVGSGKYDRYLSEDGDDAWANVNALDKLDEFSASDEMELPIGNYFRVRLSRV
mmetsp:Transcript_107147/g.190367  ORF Transcript_107147/g.190367 Transcript_107147/m.190367 type:complete len:185 (+) Transcript_107147:49-603(+)